MIKDEGRDEMTDVNRGELGKDKRAKEWEER